MRRFTVRGELGRGGFGRVLRVVESGTDMAPELALKLVLGRWSPESEPMVRLRDEARLLARLRHPSVVRLFGVVHLDVGPGLLMELVEGPNLAELLLSGGAPPPRAALQIAANVADALAYAGALPDEAGAPLRLLHRDVKPGNISVTRHGEVKLLDFGIGWADLVGREARSGPDPRGTVTYMAPEQRRGERSETADVYALGLVLWNLIAGTPHPELPQTEDDQGPFREALGRRALEVLAELGVTGRPAALVVGLVLSMVEWAPDARPDPAAVAELAHELAGQLQGQDLRAWAAVVVPPLVEQRRQVEVEAVVGAELVEGAPAVTASAPATEPEAPPAVSAEDPGPLPAPRRPAGWALPPGLAAALGLLLLAGLWGWSVRPAPPPLPSPAAPVRVARAAPALEVTPALGRAEPEIIQASINEVDVKNNARVTGVTLATVRVAGDATRVELLTAAAPLPLPAQVAPGTYDVLVTFPNGRRPFVYGQLIAEPGATYEITCSLAMLLCRTVEAP